MEPTIGRIVHFHPEINEVSLGAFVNKEAQASWWHQRGGRERVYAAIITAVHPDGRVNLHCFSAMMMHGTNWSEAHVPQQSAVAAVEPAVTSRCWSWPPRT